MAVTPRSRQLCPLFVFGAIALCLGFSALCAFADPEVNLAFGKPNVCTAELLPGWTGLTDGVIDSDTAPGCFATDNSDHFPKEVTIDLGMLYPIDRIAVHNSANGNTRKVAISVSSDGRQYASLREFIFPAGEYMALVHSFSQRMARYVRVTMQDTWKGGQGGDNILYLREIQVFGDKAGGRPSPPNSLALTTGRNPVFTPYWVRLFQRYCLEGRDDVHIAFIGDSYALPNTPPGGDWPTLFASSLGRHYGEMRVRVEYLATPDQSPVAMLDKAKEWVGIAAPDIIVMAYGRDATLADVAPEKFRSELATLTDALMAKSDGALVLVTPPPLLQAETLDGFAKVKGKSTTALAYEVESIAVSRNLPLVRSGSVLAQDAQDIKKMYRDAYRLNDAGQQVLAAALFGAFR